MNIVTKLTLGLALVAGTFSTYALNYDPTKPAPAPILDAGYTYDQVNAAGIDSVDSPYLYTPLATAATFTITDDFVVGDTYKVYDFGALILTTAVQGGGQPYGGGVGGAAYSWGSVLLSAGNHSLTVQGDGAGGLPAGFYTRLDTARQTPDTGSFALVGGVVWAGLLGLRRRVS